MYAKFVRKQRVPQLDLVNRGGLMLLSKSHLTASSPAACCRPAGQCNKSLRFKSAWQQTASAATGKLRLHLQQATKMSGQCHAARSSGPSQQQQPRSCDILVVGGGLGGLALAVGLQQLGRNYLLCEAADELRTATGTLIGLGANATAALDGISHAIIPKLKAVAQPITRVESSVRPPSEPERVAVRPLGQELYNMRWAATQAVLADMVDEEHILCSHKCIGYTESSEDHGWVTVQFEGQPDIRARMVVAADGVRSAIRNAMLPGDVPRYLGHMNWNAVRLVPGSSSGPDGDLLKSIMDSDKPGGFSTHVYLINAGCDYQFWQVRMQFDEPSFTVPGRAGGGGVPGSKARVLQRLEELGWHDVIQAVEATDESLIFERCLWDRVPIQSWSSSSKRVVLLGDAAHAMHSGPGQGARSAFEDAHQLVLALQRYWPDATMVVQQYEAARVPRATTIQYIAASGCGLKDLRESLLGFWGDSASDKDAGRRRFAEVSKWMSSYLSGVDPKRHTRAVGPAS